ncbi:hypothetical protein ABFS82_02G163200 [Erythranthe guttata]
MKGAVLEVVLVSAKGIQRASFVGDSGYHVIIQCGNQICRSKTSSGSFDKIYWNEKFIFEFPVSELDSLSHLNLKIVKEGHFSDRKFVGETIIFLRRIMVEGNYKGLIDMNPCAFNVVLEDDTYKGQITIGLKFIPNTVLPMEINEFVHEENDIGESIFKIITSVWQMQWWRLFFAYRNKNFIDKHKDN